MSPTYRQKGSLKKSCDMINSNYLALGCAFCYIHVMQAGTISLGYSNYISRRGRGQNNFDVGVDGDELTIAKNKTFLI